MWLTIAGKRVRRVLAALTVAVLLAGCTLTVEPDPVEGALHVLKQFGLFLSNIPQTPSQDQFSPTASSSDPLK